MKYIHFLILIVIGFTTCNNNSSENQNQIKFDSDHWLIGDWIYFSGNDTIIEQWSSINEKELMAVNVKLKKGDSIPIEWISLRLDGNKYIFEANVKNQNNGEGVAFSLVSFEDKKIVFENREHDFPQIIKYQLLDKHNCLVSISGIINKQESRVDFSLKRIPD